MKLYLIRHGETDVNRVLNHGVTAQMHNDPMMFKEGESTNIPLNINGRNQAEEIGTLLPDHIDSMYSSPLLRAKETAEIIARSKGIDASGIIFSDKLVEYNMGSLEGLSLNKKIEIAGGKVWGSSLSCTYDYTKWGGDSWKTIYDRVDSFLKELRENNDDNKTIVCVTSSGVIRMTYKLLFSDKAPNITQHIKIENGSVHTFVV